MVVAVVVIFVAMLLPAFGGSHKSPSAPCMSHVRQIDLAFQMYADDNNGKFAIQTSVTNHGTMEFLERNQTFPHFQKLSGYIFYFPTFVCPADTSRHAAESYANLTDTNLSYFLSADVSTNNPATSILIGDRNLEANGVPVGHGTFTLNTNMNLVWNSSAMHRRVGVLGFADGHAEIRHSADLKATVQRQGLATMRLSVP